MATLRVKQDVRCVVFDGNGNPTTLTADVAFDSTDPVVKANPWAFEKDNDGGRETPGRVVAVNLPEFEQATAAPGEKRGTKHAAPTSPRAADLDTITASQRENPAAFADVEDEGGHGPITTQNFGAAGDSDAGDADDLSGASPDDKVSGKASAAKGKVPRGVAKATSNATPKTVKGRRGR